MLAIRDSSFLGEGRQKTPATQGALDWQADQEYILDDLEVFHHLKQMAAPYSATAASEQAITTLTASVQSPIFSLRAQGRPPTSFHHYSLRMIVFEYNYYVCNIFGYDFNGMDESGIGESDMHKLLPCDGDGRRPCYTLLPWFLMSPRNVWATSVENSAVLWTMQLDFVDLLTPFCPRLGKRRRALNFFHQVSLVEGGEGYASRGEGKRFKGVPYRPERRTWVAEMGPPKCENTVSFGDFKYESQAARAVDAAFHYFQKDEHINFADSCEILASRCVPTGLNEEDKLRFVKEQAKWLASMASTLPSSTVNPFEIPHSSRDCTAVTFRFRSFSEITSSKSDTDTADDGDAQSQPVLTAADYVAAGNELVEEGQKNMFQWILDDGLVDPVQCSPGSFVHITDESGHCTLESSRRVVASSVNAPQFCDEEQRVMSPGLDFLNMLPLAPALFPILSPSDF